MKSNAQRRPAPPSRPAYRTLHGWALGALIENHAVSECADQSATLGQAVDCGVNHADPLGCLDAADGAGGLDTLIPAPVTQLDAFDRRVLAGFGTPPILRGRHSIHTEEHDDDRRAGNNQFNWK